MIKSAAVTLSLVLLSGGLFQAHAGSFPHCEMWYGSYVTALQPDDTYLGASTELRISLGEDSSHWLIQAENRPPFEFHVLIASCGADGLTGRFLGPDMAGDFRILAVEDQYVLDPSGVGYSEGRSNWLGYVPLRRVELVKSG